jgi:subtilisin-like proprotein convertase family protein
MSKVLLNACLAVAGATAISASASAQVFSNPAPIQIVDSSVAVPYPSDIIVAGLGAPIASMTVTITGISHTFPDDFGILLLGPNGNCVVIEDGAGGGEDIVNLTWTFDDAAAAPLPSAGQLVSGTFQPGQNQYSDVFAAPAPPAASWFTSFGAAYGGSNGNGTWSLLIQDFVGGDSGVVSGGWSINFTLVPGPSGLAAFFLAGCLGSRRRRA